MASQTFVVWSVSNANYACVLGDLIGAPDPYALNIGLPQAEDFPDDVHFHLHPGYPYHTILTDNLENTDLVIVISKRLKDFIESYGVSEVEYLPVTIFDHKGRIASDSYYILHLLNPVDCLDIDQCGPTWSNVDPDNLLFIKRLVIDPSKIPPERALFRPLHYIHAALVRDDLANALQNAGFAGLRWVPIDQYPET